MIAAIGKNREIGFQNKLLWNLPNDLKHFKEITSGHTIVMGKNTFESIGKALPNRINIVLTRDKNYEAPDCEIKNDINKLINLYKDSKEEVFIIGGASIYDQFIFSASKLYLTLVDDSPQADTFFPPFEEEFKNKISESKVKEEKEIKYKFIELTR